MVSGFTACVLDCMTVSYQFVVIYIPIEQSCPYCYMYEYIGTMKSLLYHYDGGGGVSHFSRNNPDARGVGSDLFVITKLG